MWKDKRSMSNDEVAVTAVLLTYNSDRYVEEAVRSVLNQRCPPMEVIISDDASSDETYDVVCRVVESYRGPHRVSVLRQNANCGSKSAHLNRVIHECSGELIILFDDDDVYHASRVSRIIDGFASDPEVHAVYSSYKLIREDGSPLGLAKPPHPRHGYANSKWFASVDAFASGSTLGVRREVFDAFSPLPRGVSEDVVLPFRASLLGKVAYIDEPLVSVRRRSGSLTSNFARFDSMESYRARLLAGIDRAKLKSASRMADLDEAERLFPERSSQIEDLRSIVESSFEHTQLSAGLVDRRAWKRIAAFAKIVAVGAYRNEWAQNLALALTPNRYLRHKRKRLRIGARVTSGR